MRGKGSKKDKSSCSEHVLSMRARNQGCYFSQSVSVEMCSRGASWRGKKNAQTCYEGPVFNRDQNFSTPTFILASQKVPFQQQQKDFQPTNLKSMIEIDRRRYSSYDCEKSLIFVAKPNSKSMYCSVCKERYEDYLQHVGTSRHRNNIRTNTFTKYIYQQADTYERNKNITSPLPTSTDTSNVIIISSDQEGCTRKRVKRCPDYQPAQHKNNPKFEPPQLVNPLQYFPNAIPYNYPMHFNFNYNINFMGMPGVFNSIPPINYIHPPLNYGQYPYGLTKQNEKKNCIIVQDDKQ